MSNTTPPLTNPLIENDYFYLSSDGTYYIVGTEDYKKYEEMKTKLSEDVVIPEEYNGKPVKEIGKFSFYETDIRSLFVPDSIEKMFMCSSPFAENKLMESIRLSENILELPDHTFCGNKKLKYVKIPDSITRIPSGAFYNCENLSCVEFPKNLTHIDRDAFHRTSLTSVSIPESVETINAFAFNDTSKLTDIIFKGKPVFKRVHGGDVDMDEPIHMSCTLDNMKNIYAVDGKGWTGNETFMFGGEGDMCGGTAAETVFKTIEILPEGGATVAKNMTVKSMVFA